jgi:glycyl-tRNA synthetase beta chain
MADLLFEIGLEEVPARMIAAAEAELLRRTVALLGRERLLPERFDLLSGAASYSTPRRLAVLVRGVLARQEDVSEEVTGPAAKIAFKDGVPTAAAEAFARKSGVAVADLKTVMTPKGEYLAATSVKPGREAAAVIASELPKEVAAIYWAKTMYWRAGKPERFVRPVLWLVCLLGDEIVPVSFGGKTAGRATFGHRVLSGGEAFEIVAPESYVAQLEGEFVLADVEVRRQRIRKALDKVTREVTGARWREDEALVDQVTHLTEWPTVLLGNFEPEYLALPEEVLVTVMRDHQKYFAVDDSAGKLAPHFLAVLNISTDENSAATIRQGNERVLRARFNDARFFWEFDQRVPLVERVKLLENVTFQKDLGSYAAKSERVRSIAEWIGNIVAERGIAVDFVSLNEAARLAKADLTAELVKEFTELQGVIGGLYAKVQGVSTTAAEAIYDQYLPAGMDDGVPRSAEGAILGIADRADTIAGMFGLGMEPTGSKDPFALRRAANGIVKILAETGLPISVETIATASVGFHKPDVVNRIILFFFERVEFYLRESRGQAYDVVKAVMSAGWNDVRDVVARAEAVTEVRGGDDFIAISAAFKRMKNILQQAMAKGETMPTSVNDELLVQVEERELARQSAALAQEAEELRKAGDYGAALQAVAALRPQVDGFFDAVMVMAPEAELRGNRLALLMRIAADFSRIADFSEIVAAG